MRLLVTITCLCFFGCSSDLSKNSGQIQNKSMDSIENQDQFSFKEYTNQIPLIKLPLKINSLKDYKLTEIILKPELLNKYTPNGYKLIGALFKKRDRIGLMYFNEKGNTTFLYILDNQGFPIEMKQLSINNLKFKECDSIGQYFTITNNLNIELAYVRGYLVIDFDSTIIDTLQKTIYVERYKVDSIGNLITK